MKNAAKVFLIISMILYFELVFPLILGAIALSKLDHPRSKEEVRTWGILSIIFVSILGGIFMLCIKEEDLNFKEISFEESLTGYNPSNDPSQKLIDLKELYDSGVIDETIYKEKREQYIKEL